MKLLLACCCMSIVVPSNAAMIPTKCKCGVSSIWWENPKEGIIAVQSSNIDNVAILGIHNGLLTTPSESFTTKETMKKIIEETPDNFLFKMWDSLIVKFQPGTTSDSKFILK